MGGTRGSTGRRAWTVRQGGILGVRCGWLTNSEDAHVLAIVLQIGSTEAGADPRGRQERGVIPEAGLPSGHEPSLGEGEVATEGRCQGQVGVRCGAWR